MNMKHTAGAVCFITCCLLFCFSSALWAFQDMVCPVSGKTDRAVCSTLQEESTGMVKISCRTTQAPRDIPLTYTCTKLIRDWGKTSSPYAHTSTTWRCVNGSIEIFIFTADFYQDSIRCDLVCGKCETKWHTQP